MQAAREKLLSACQSLDALGLNRGTSGNASLRVDSIEGLAGFLMTPSGMAVEVMTASDLVWMDFAGHAEGRHAPSSEWRFHRDILRARQEVNAVVHTHSMFATTLSTLRQDLPAFHYMIAVAGGNNVRCAPYALFGSQLLSDYALAALFERNACLLANHGMIALGRDLGQAVRVAQEVEALCAQYMHALQIGQPIILSDAEMDAVIAQFKGYGSWAK